MSDLVKEILVIRKDSSLNDKVSNTDHGSVYSSITPCDVKNNFGEFIVGAEPVMVKRRADKCASQL